MDQWKFDELLRPALLITSSLNVMNKLVANWGKHDGKKQTTDKLLTAISANLGIRLLGYIATAGCLLLIQ